MKKIDIRNYRLNEEFDNVCFTDPEFIIKELKNHSLVEKEFGLCAEPFNWYYQFGKVINSYGVSTESSLKNSNVFYVRVNNETSTFKKRRYYYSIEIKEVKKEMFYVIALAQSSSRYSSVNSVNHAVYFCKKNEIKSALDEIFKDVEFLNN